MVLKSVEPLAVGLAGTISSGKTSIARALWESTGWTIASFGGYISKEARLRGLDWNKREVLQDLGDELIAKGWQHFCLAVLSDSNWKQGNGLIIDGIRHVEAVSCIRKLVTPLRLIFVYVSTPDDIRRERYVAKYNGSTLLDTIEQHTSELQVKTAIKMAATVVVDGANEPAKNADIILKRAG